MAGVKCSYVRPDQTPCRAWAVQGATVCNRHGGALPVVRQKAMVRHELSQWVIGEALDDPGEMLLRLVTQSAKRVRLYSELLEQMYGHAELLGPESEHPGLPPGVQALIGGTWSDDGQGRVYQTGEQIRGLVALEAQERDRCANFCAKAIAAGLAERTVRMAENVGAAITVALLAGLDAAGVTGEMRIKAQNAAADSLMAITA